MTSTRRRLFFLFLCFNTVVFSQGKIDSAAHIQTVFIDSLNQQNMDSVSAKRDSFIYVAPIPDIGSIKPFEGVLQPITSETITWEEYRSLYDILAVQRGTFIRDLASPGQKNEIAIGGLSERHIAILVDGIPYNDFYTGTLNLWLLPVDAIERIEYVSGTQSIFYDGKSGAGTINIVTRNYDNNRAITNLRYSQGVTGYVHTDAFFAQNVMRNFNLTLGLSHHGYGSNKESQNYRGRFFNSNDDAWTFRGKARYNIADWFGLSFFYLYNKTWTGLHGGVNYSNTPSIFDGLQAYVENEESYEKYSNSHYTFTAAFFPFADSTLLATLSYYRFDRLREFRDEENRSVLRNGIFTRRDFASLTDGIKLHLYSNTGFNIIHGYIDVEEVKSTRIVTVGIKDNVTILPLLTISPFAVARDFNGNKLVHAGAEATLQFTSWFSVFGGITEEITNDKSASVNTTTNLFLYDAAAIQNRESFSISEVGCSVTFPSTFIGAVSYKRSVLKNPVVFDTIPLFSSFRNVLPTTFTYEAVSASAHVMLGEFHLEGNANYTKQPSLVHNGISVVMYPELTAYSSAYYHGLLAKGNLDLKIGVRGRFYSKQTGMKPYDEAGVWIRSSILEYGPSGAMDFFAIGKIGSAYVHFIWENLTGNQYLLTPVYPMYDSNIRFGLSWQFLD